MHSMVDNSSLLSLLTVLKPGGSFRIGMDPGWPWRRGGLRLQGLRARISMGGKNHERFQRTRQATAGDGRHDRNGAKNANTV